MQLVQSTPFGWNGIYRQFGSAIPDVVGLEGFDCGDIPPSILARLDEVIE